MPHLKAGSNWYEVVTQSAACSCGMACAAMVVKAASNIHLSEKDFQGESSTHRGKHMYDAKGASPLHLLAVLKKWKVSATPYYGPSESQITKLLTQASPRRPVIIGIVWDQSNNFLPGGLMTHMIVSPGLNPAGTHWVALDPATLYNNIGAATEQDIGTIPAYNREGFLATIDLIIAT